MDKSVIKEHVWFVVKVLLWYIFYQLACTGSVYALNELASWIMERDTLFGESALLSGSLFLSSSLMIWHLVTFGYVKISRNFFSEVQPGMLALIIIMLTGAKVVLGTVVEWIALPDFLEQTFMDLSGDMFGVLSMALLGPVAEELMFRGAIQGYLMRRCKNPWTGILVSSLVFGAIHMNPQQVLYATLLGIVFGWLYYRTRSLLPVIAGHVLNNAMAVAAMKIWGYEEPVVTDDWMLMFPSVIFITALIVPLVLKINRELPPVPCPWRAADE